MSVSRTSNWKRGFLAIIVLLGGLAVGEVLPAHGATITVTSGADSGAGTLRAALASASSGDTITFDPSVTTVELTSASLSIASTSITIQGPGANLLTVRRSSAGGTPNFRIFTIAPGAGNSVSISGLTIMGGNETPGGGIAFTGAAGSALNLSRVAVVGNNASWGGGIDATGSQTSSVLIDSSIVEGNTTNGGQPCGFCNGAGMKAEVPTVIVNSTFSGNASATNAGGIKVDSAVTIINSTFANNSATALGGGIHVVPFNNTPDLVLKNSLIADNTHGVNGHQCDLTSSWGSPILSVNLNNLIEDGSCNFLWSSGAASGSATGFVSGDPSLGTLSLNGASTKSHEIVSGSPAFGAGDATTCSSAPVGGLDQRGATRLSPCSIGSYDGILSAPTTTVTPTTVTPTTVTPTTVASGQSSGGGGITTSTPSPSASGSTVAPGSLPETGSDSSSLTGFAFVLMLLGLLLFQRRRGNAKG